MLEGVMTPNELKWACRRGMLELDLILGAYADTAYADATPEHRAAFLELLHCQDQSLFNWLVKREPAPSQFVSIIHALWAHYENRSM